MNPGAPLARWRGRPLGNRVGGDLHYVSPCATPTLGPSAWRTFALSLLGPETANPIEVVRGHREAEQHGHLELTKHSKEPPGEIDEGTFEGGVDRLHHLTATHRDPPGGRAEWDLLEERQLGRTRGQNARATDPHV